MSRSAAFAAMGLLAAAILLLTLISILLFHAIEMVEKKVVTWRA